METKELKIEGMTCNHCVMRVQKALEAIVGSGNARVNLEQKNAQVSYDPSRVTATDLVTAVEKAGYKAS